MLTTSIGCKKKKPVRGTPYKPLRTFAHTYEHCAQPQLFPQQGACAQMRRLCATEAPFAPTISEPSDTSGKPLLSYSSHSRSQDLSTNRCRRLRICANQSRSRGACGDDQGHLLMPITNHGLMRTPITTPGLMRMSSLIDDKPPGWKHDPGCN